MVSMEGPTRPLPCTNSRRQQPVGMIKGVFSWTCHGYEDRNTSTPAKVHVPSFVLNRPEIRGSSTFDSKLAAFRSISQMSGCVTRPEPCCSAPDRYVEHNYIITPALSSPGILFSVRLVRTIDEPLFVERLTAIVIDRDTEVGRQDSANARALPINPPVDRARRGITHGSGIGASRRRRNDPQACSGLARNAI